MPALFTSAPNAVPNEPIAETAFELSQTLREKWLKEDVTKKRQLQEITCLNFSLDGATLVPEIRKPFDVRAEGHFVPSSRGGEIRTRDLLLPKQAR